MSTSDKVSNTRFKALMLVLLSSVLCFSTTVGLYLYASDRIHQERLVGNVSAELTTDPKPLTGAFSTTYGVSAMVAVSNAEQHKELIGQQISVVLDPQWQNLTSGSNLQLSSCELVDNTLVNCQVVRVQ